ncbi:MAG: hypothetical protein JSV92_02210 [archaeon]|nr:MAG: hypothetical protein JSV92_02210 [archaeon]
MAFWKKKNERRKRELEGIKDKVEGKKPLPPPPPGEIEEVKETKKKAPIIETPPEPKPVPKVSLAKEETEGESAPLFIKIEKYEMVLDKLMELKNTLQTLTRLISFHSEVDELKADIFSRIKGNISSLTDLLIAMDEIFVKPERPDITESKEKEEGEVEEQILDLGEELRHLKRELSKIE